MTVPTAVVDLVGNPVTLENGGGLHTFVPRSSPSTSLVLPQVGGEDFASTAPAIDSREDTLRSNAVWGGGKLAVGDGGGSGRLGELVVEPGETVVLNTDYQEFPLDERPIDMIGNVGDDPGGLGTFPSACHHGRGLRVQPHRGAAGWLAPDRRQQPRPRLLPRPRRRPGRRHHQHVRHHAARAGLAPAERQQPGRELRSARGGPEDRVPRLGLGQRLRHRRTRLPQPGPGRARLPVLRQRWPHQRRARRRNQLGELLAPGGRGEPDQRGDRRRRRLWRRPLRLRAQPPPGRGPGPLRAVQRRGRQRGLRRRRPSGPGRGPLRSRHAGRRQRRVPVARGAPSTSSPCPSRAATAPS